jgi:hypothetical protein
LYFGVLKLETMKVNIQIKSIFGKLLFEFEKEDNTIKETVLEAIKSSANLSSADLYGANLRSANLSSADLYGANLRSANLNGANLNGANLYGANLRSANLSSADLKKIVAVTTIVPEGDLIVWKKLQGGLIAQLLVPIKAKRVNAIGSRKCRFEFVKTIAIFDGKKKVKAGAGSRNNKTIYKVGELTYPDEFDPSPLIECSHGIHAFITKQEAIDY